MLHFFNQKLNFTVTVGTPAVNIPLKSRINGSRWSWSLESKLLRGTHFCIAIFFLIVKIVDVVH